MRKFIQTSLLFTLTVMLTYNSMAYQLMGIKWAEGAYNYHINPVGVDNTVDYSSKTSTVINAAGLWQGVSTTNVGVNYLGSTTNTGWGVNDGVNVVTWKTNDWSGSVIGISTSWYTSSYIIDSDIKLNTAFANDSRLTQLVTHEVGHSLGIDHTQESGAPADQDEIDAIMYWLLQSQTDLNRHDKCAITAIYPASGSCSPTYAEGYFVCSPCCSDDGSVSVAITDNVYTYSGTAKSVTVTTSPSSLAHTVTYYNQFDIVVAAPTNSGVYDVTVTITEPGYESEGPFYGTLTINKKSLSVVADNKEVNYGEAQPAYTYNISGYVSGENSSNLATLPSAYILETWPVNPGSYTIYVNGGAAVNYSFTYQSGILTVNGLTVNEVFVLNHTHTYNGTNKEITVTTDPLGVGNIVTYKFNSITVTSKINAGIYDVIITIDEPGYSPDQYLTTMTINKATLTATADDKSVALGDPEPTYTIGYTGFVNGENQTQLTTQPLADVDGTWPLPAGTYPIAVTGGTDDNYSITRVNGILTVTAFSADSVKFANLEYNYNGLAHFPTITTYPNGLDYDVFYTNSLSSQTTNPINADNYLVEVIITEPGYERDTFTTIFTIEKVNLEISVNDTTIVYGAPQPIYTYTYIGFVNGETKFVLDQHPNLSTGFAWPLLPGIYTNNLSGGLDNNYNYILTNGTVTVLPAKVDSFTFQNIVFTYDGLKHEATIHPFPDSVDYAATYTNSKFEVVPEPISADTYELELVVTETGYDRDTFRTAFIIGKAPLQVTSLHYTVDYGDPEPDYALQFAGFVNNETSTVIDTLPKFDVAGNWPLLPGIYPILVTGGWDNNYQISAQNGLLTIESSGVILSVSDTIQTYNGMPHEVAINTLPENIQTAITYKDAGLNTISPPTLPGNYTVNVIITEEGFEPLEHTASFIIQKATLSVAVQNKTINYGENLPLFNYSITGFVNGENENGLTSLPVLNLNSNPPYLPGIYPIVASGGTSDHYQFNYMNGTLTIHPLFVQGISIADTVTVYSGVSKTISVVTSPAHLGVSLAFTDTQNNLVNQPINTGLYHYTITINEPGYFNSTFHGTLEIQKAILEVGMDTINLSYGSSVPVTEINYSGWVNNETISVLDAVPTINAITNWPWDAGIYHLNIEGGIDNNYSFSFQSGILHIHQAVLTVTPDDFTISYNGSMPELTYRIEGFQFNDDISVLTALPYLYAEGENPLFPGNHSIIAEGAEANNYIFNYFAGNLWVEPIGDAAFIVSTIDTTYTGTVLGIDVNTVPEGLSYSVQYDDTPLNAGTYNAHIKITEPGYIPIEETHQILINKVVLTVSATDTSILNGTHLLKFNLKYDGFVNGENIDAIDQLPTAIAGNTWELEAGIYPIVVQGGNDNNYEFNLINGTLAVIQTYWIEVLASENGMVSLSEKGILLNGLTAEVIINENSPEFYAIANGGYQFSNWDNGSTKNPITFEKVTQNIKLTALFELKVGVDDLQKLNSIVKIYPNPAKEFQPFYVQIDWPKMDAQPAKMIITDLLGRVVAIRDEAKESNEIEGLRKGVYLINIETKQEKIKPVRFMVR